MGFSDEEVNAARMLWAERTGERIEDVPWQVVLIWERELTLDEFLRPLFWRDREEGSQPDL